MNQTENDIQDFVKYLRQHLSASALDHGRAHTLEQIVFIKETRNG
jgi:hypothetical protein